MIEYEHCLGHPSSQLKYTKSSPHRPTEFYWVCGTLMESCTHSLLLKCLWILSTEFCANLTTPALSSGDASCAALSTDSLTRSSCLSTGFAPGVQLDSIS